MHKPSKRNSNSSTRGRYLDFWKRQPSCKGEVQEAAIKQPINNYWDKVPVDTLVAVEGNWQGEEVGDGPAGQHGSWSKGISRQHTEGEQWEGQVIRSKTAGQWGSRRSHWLDNGKAAQKAPNLDRRGRKGQRRKPRKERQKHKEVGVEKSKKDKRKKRINKKEIKIRKRKTPEKGVEGLVCDRSEERGRKRSKKKEPL